MSSIACLFITGQQDVLLDLRIFLRSSFRILKNLIGYFYSARLSNIATPEVPLLVQYLAAGMSYTSYLFATSFNLISPFGILQLPDSSIGRNSCPQLSTLAPKLPFSEGLGTMR